MTGRAQQRRLWPSFRRIIFGLPTMVLIHGCLNALVVVLSFYLAIVCDPEEEERGERQRVASFSSMGIVGCATARWRS